MPNLREDLEKILNLHSRENASNTPDFILAKFLIDCLDAFDNAVRERSRGIQSVKWEPITDNEAEAMANERE